MAELGNLTRAADSASNDIRQALMSDGQGKDDSVSETLLRDAHGIDTKQAGLLPSTEQLSNVGTWLHEHRALPLVPAAGIISFMNAQRYSESIFLDSYRRLGQGGNALAADALTTMTGRAFGGAAAVGFGIAAQHITDVAFFKGEKTGAFTYAADWLATPALLLSRMPGPMKVAAMTGVHVAGRALDRAVKQSF